jgi:hypothetical protein
MVKESEQLKRLEAEFERSVYGPMTYGEALVRFAALWAEARLLNPEMGKDWLEDLQPDFAVARAVNGLPPGA